MAFFITHAAGRWQPTLSTYWITSNMDAWVARELSDPKQVEDMHVMLRRFREGDAFALASERRSRAIAALERGEFDTAVVEAAVASEVLLDAVLGYVLWERHTPASEAAEILSAPLASRLRNAFHPRLGGQWDIEREGPLKEWRDGLMNVRHRVVHAGYHPDEWRHATLSRLLSVLRSFSRTAFSQVGPPTPG